MQSTEPQNTKSLATNAPRPSKALTKDVISFVLANIAEDLSLDDLAEAAGLARFSFARRFQRDCGIPPMRWLWTFRAALAAEMISADPHWSLTDVAFTCGFSSSAHFSRAFKEAIGLSPSAHKKLSLAATPDKSGRLPGDFSNDVALRAIANAWKH